MAPCVFRLLAAWGVGLQLSACGAPPPAPAPQAEDRHDAGYAVSPTLVAVRSQAGSTILDGQATGGARVRLATPAGEARYALADANGRWSLALPPSADARIFGLSMTFGARVVQAAGYVLVTSTGEAAMLRAGSGALRFDETAPPRITGFDFDREGGAAVSGRAPVDAAVSVRLDGVVSAEGRADASGRFNVALAQPVAPGRHQVEVRGGAFQDTAIVEVRPAAPLAGGPFRVTSTPFGLRTDWMTPGGGVQSTLLLD